MGLGTCCDELALLLLGFCGGCGGLAMVLEPGLHGTGS